ncbi:MAG: aspartate kinase [Pyrinomonadaceae bacterium]|nr:aspartate kinase [Phycisphaerales bacterium]
MKLVVQKFGGSSVANADRMRKCAERAVAAKQRGDRVVMVVSAMGDTTDDLLELAAKVTQTPSRREIDQLLATGEQVSSALMAMTLQGLGHDAISMTGAQSGIQVESNSFTRARITSIDQSRLMKEIDAGRIPVVTGFQGVTDSGETATLGRGGSDTTAVALAAALKADVCEIYTDVDGIFTSDPRIVPTARRRDKFTYDEMLEAASLGARVMHPRAVEVGKKYNVQIRVLHSQEEGLGTLIAGEDDSMESRVVACVALKNDLGRIMIRDLPNRAGVQSAIFEPIAAAKVSVDDIIQEETSLGHIALTFTLDRGDLAEVKPMVERAAKIIWAEKNGGVGNGGADAGIVVRTGYCKVSAIGAGMRSHSGGASTMFKTLAEQGIRIENITTSEIAISCILEEADGPKALRAVHDAFGLASAAN